MVYFETVPKLWNDTIEAHRHAVRDAVLDATAALVSEHGLASVSMSRIAQETGIGRATLYKYFPDLEAILAGWHERQVLDHLRQLELIRDQAGSAGRRLEAVLESSALMSREHGATALSAMLHRGDHVAHARHQLAGFLQTLIAEGAAAGELRDDVPPQELAAYCLHALTAADGLRSKAAAQRLVSVVLAGLRPPT
ncbi:MAG TPA: TetR/AcrR family transcriptional regulator [Blastococcus sp.]|jgi:AcrR family transcriptional regulator